MTMHKGKLIVIEGIEGSGKSTQAALLYQRLQKNNIPSLLVREPGGTRTGEIVREALLHGEQISGMTELFLFSAARYEVINQVINPALARGQIVVCDRFIASTIAYQGFGRGVNLSHISYINELSSQGLNPKIGFLLDIPPEISFTRKDTLTKDRIENEKLDFHKLVRNGYLKTANADPELWHILDGASSVDKIQKLIWESVYREIMHII